MFLDALPHSLAADPMFWLMLAFIVIAFTPYCIYALAVLGANLRGRSVPSFGETMSWILPGRPRPSSAAQLDEIAATTRRILELLGETRAASSEQAHAEPETEKDRAQAQEPEDSGIDRSAAWSDRRRSDRGREARGTAYSGAEPGKTYKPGTGSRTTDRPSFSEELRAALRQLKLKDAELPDVASLTRAYRDAVKTAHPDAGGSQEGFLTIKAAYDKVLKEISTLRRSAGA